MERDNTIAALVTAPSPAGVAIVRVSGADASKSLSLFRSSRDPLKHPREMILGSIETDQQKIDQALAVSMPGPNSFTGEDVIEFHLHGSPLVARQLLKALFDLQIESAQPGEFTKRAFLNGKLDLVQAEAVNEIIMAGSDRALTLAQENLDGKLSGTIESLGEPLRDILAEIEASIDFPEEDIDPDSNAQISRTLLQANSRLLDLIQTYNYGHMVTDGFRVLLFGKPNVGKSTLLNRLLGKDRAIVTEVSGTTRDVIEEPADISGHRFVFCDSAGIRNTTDRVEQIGVSLALERLAWADLVLFLVDSAESFETQKDTYSELTEHSNKVWVLANKADLSEKEDLAELGIPAEVQKTLLISAKHGAGCPELVEALLEAVETQQQGAAESSHVITQERHRACLEKAHQSITRSVEALRGKMPLEIASAELRIALSALEEIVGKTYTEDILGRIFSKFCIGK